MGVPKKISFHVVFVEDDANLGINPNGCLKNAP
jgi:hypothetical protein